MPDTPPIIVNPQVTDAVTQTNTKVLAEAPAMGVALVYQMFAQSVGLSIQNATSNQHNMQTVAGAATAKAIEMITKL
ncbi:MAG: RebB family R body protein [Myxococcales bacterium]|nr:RebB family R body protein [Myxococcales bacterium]